MMYESSKGTVLAFFFIIDETFAIIKRIMDYGRKNLNKNKAAFSNRKVAARKKFILSFSRAIVILVLFIVAGGVFYGLNYVKRLIEKCPDVRTVDISPSGFSTKIYDATGAEVESLAASGANREYATLDEIPDEMEDAFIAIEDSRFYSHNGIDVRGIIRAGFIGITTGDFSQGASTITQQLLKNNYFTTWTSENTMRDRLERKIQEQYLALKLEEITTKQEILENYLNTINLGQNTLGVQAAADRYFNKSVSDLTLSESAVIAAITQNPTRYNPISNPEENAKRRKKVLDDMLDQELISQSEHDIALSDNVYERIQVVNNAISGSSTTYFVDALTDNVIKDLVDQRGYSESQAYQALYSGGLSIYSTQDPAIQAICDEEVNNSENYAQDPKISFNYRLTVTKSDGTTKNYSEQTMLSYYQANNKAYNIDFKDEESAREAIEAYKAEIMEPGDTVAEGGESIVFTLQPQVAMTVMDQSNGYVVALVGGRGEKTASKTLNRATGITRQPGSTFKIVAAYAPALDAGGMTLATVQDDAPMTYANGTSLSNYDDHYRGFTNIRTAITYSINVVTVKTLTEIGTGLGYEYAENLGISTLVSGDNNQSLAIGGITNGVTNLELAGAYAAIANQGVYNKPIFYTKVVDRSGNILLDNSTNPTRQVLKPTTAWLLTSAMKDVMTLGTGRAANFSDMGVVGKSGTTTKDRDTVFAGFTPYYTCVIWGGNDDNAVQSSTSYSKAIWKATMSRIHDGLEYRDFEKPANIVEAEVCRKSGKLAVPGVCDNDPRGSQVYTEYFEAGTEPTETCDHHTVINICVDSGQPASVSCPPDRLISGVYIIGGSPATDDEPYLITQDQLNTSCLVHGVGGPYIFSDPVTSVWPEITETPIEEAVPEQVIQ